MHAKNQISLIHKTLYGIMSLAVFLAAFGIRNLPTVRVQRVGTGSRSNCQARAYGLTAMSRFLKRMGRKSRGINA